MNSNDDMTSPVAKVWQRGAVTLTVGFIAAIAVLLALSGCSGGGHGKAAADTPQSSTPPVVAAAPSSSAPAAPAGAAQGVFGQTAYTNVGPADPGVVKVVVNAPTVVPKDAQSWPTQPGDMCVTFKVAVINNGSGAVPIPGKWALRGADGRDYHKVTGCTADDNEMLPDGPMQPQAAVSGPVTFIGPAHGVLMYKPPMSLIDTIDWTY
jgi:hypothetical protein